MPGNDEHGPRQPAAEAAAATQVREGVELAIRQRLAAGDALGAAADVTRFYGPEIFGFLVGVLGDSEISRDVYACVIDRFLRDLPRFSWRCSLRTWTYAGARAELAIHRGRANRPRPRPSRAPTSGPAPTSTISCRPTNLRSKIALLRACLQEEDRELLILRIDRALEWRELAVTSLGERATEFEIERESTRLRARFALVRSELAQSARQQRLIGPE
jgi:DNA-directed RNA polymerase specialized sigma24 family protein